MEQETDRAIIREKLYSKGQELQLERNFEGLLDVYDRLFGTSSASSASVIMFKKMYCLIRLGRPQDAIMVSREWNWITRPGMDPDILDKLLVVISVFHTVPVENFGENEIKMLKFFLNDPKISKEVKEIIFDYEDILEV